MQVGIAVPKSTYLLLDLTQEELEAGSLRARLKIRGREDNHELFFFNFV